MTCAATLSLRTSPGATLLSKRPSRLFSNSTRGDDIIELGVSLSVRIGRRAIQSSSERAVANRVSMRECLELSRPRSLEVDIVAFSYLRLNSHPAPSDLKISVFA